MKVRQLSCKDAEFEEALKKDKEKEELARQKEEEMMTSYEKKEKRKEELKVTFKEYFLAFYEVIQCLCVLFFRKE